MNLFIMYAVALVAVAVLVYMLLKKADVKMTLLILGIVLFYVAYFMGNQIFYANTLQKYSAIPLLDPLSTVVKQFGLTLSGAGLTVLILFGYASYMTSIGANDVTVRVLTAPLKGIKSAYILVPAVFLIGNLMSLVVPSASSLAVILLATLYPVMRKAGMSPLTAAAVIATTATVTPTPLGADNVAVANAVKTLGGEWANFSATDYVFKYHAIISIPTLVFMAALHYFAQKWFDKKQYPNGIDNKDIELAAENVKEKESAKGGKLFTTVYSLLPILPILLLLAVYAINQNMPKDTKINLTVEVCALICFFTAIICEIIRNRKFFSVLTKTDEFFKGMASGLGVAALMAAAAVFVNGLYSIGLISELQNATKALNGSGMSFMLPLVIVIASMVLVLLTGSGTVLIYTLANLVPALATAAGISMFAVFVPLSLTGNLMRAVSPIAAVIMIVAGATKESPLSIVKRTSIPMIGGVVFMFVLSLILL